MDRGFSKLFWALGVVGLMVIVGVCFAANQSRRQEAARVQRDLEGGMHSAKRTSMEELEKFLDGQEKKKLEGQRGGSESEGQEPASTRKVKRELDREAIDLERFLKEQPDTFRKDEGILAEGSTDLHQEVMWRIVGDWVYFRLAFSPYDEATNSLRRKPGEAIFLCFNDSAGQRVVPAASSARIPIGHFYRQWKNDKPVGWAFSGKLSLSHVDPSSLDHSRVGWIFSQELHTHLRDLKEIRSGGGHVESTKVRKP